MAFKNILVLALGIMSSISFFSTVEATGNEVDEASSSDESNKSESSKALCCQNDYRFIRTTLREKIEGVSTFDAINKAYRQTYDVDRNNPEEGPTEEERRILSLPRIKAILSELEEAAHFVSMAFASSVIKTWFKGFHMNEEQVPAMLNDQSPDVVIAVQRLSEIKLKLTNAFIHYYKNPIRISRRRLTGEELERHIAGQRTQAVQPANLNSQSSTEGIGPDGFFYA